MYSSDDKDEDVGSNLKDRSSYLLPIKCYSSIGAIDLVEQGYKFGTFGMVNKASFFPVNDCKWVCVCVCVFIYIYSRTSIIQTTVCHLNVKSVQTNEFIRICELSDYLAS